MVDATLIADVQTSFSRRRLFALSLPVVILTYLIYACLLYTSRCV